MIQQIGQFELRRIGDRTTLNHRRSAKDIWDLIWTTGLGSISLIMMLVIIRYWLWDGMEWAELLAAVVCGIAGCWQLGDAIARLKEPTKGVITIDHQAQAFSLILPDRTRKQFPVSEWQSFHYELKKEFVTIEDSTKIRYWIEVEMVLHSKQRIYFATIRPTEIVESSRKIVEEELVKQAQELIKMLRAKFSEAPIPISTDKNTGES